MEAKANAMAGGGGRDCGGAVLIQSCARKYHLTDRNMAVNERETVSVL